MKKLLLNEILICSHAERSAKRVTFDQKRTLIYGKNDTGKSSLIKSIFLTFGAEPGKLHPEWKKLDPISMVKFSIDSESFAILKDGKDYAIFDGKGTLLQSFASITSQLGPYLAHLLNFKIKLPDNNNKIITPPPAFIFLPFYVDQDTGWKDNWNSFAKLGQIPRFRDPIIYYHTGIRPNEYYEKQSQVKRIIEQINELTKQKDLTNELIKNIQEKLSTTEFNIDIDEFKEEVKDLLVQCELLKNEEERFKRKQIDLYNRKLIVETQIEITISAYKEADADYKFANGKLEHSVECPTCGAEYENSFGERFEIAKDADRCQELLSELKEELYSINEKIESNTQALNRTSESIASIEIILAKKKGDIELKDIIESAGRNELKSIFSSRMDELNKVVYDNTRVQQKLQTEIANLENKKRREAIQTDFRIWISSHLRDLDVTRMKASDFKKISTKINDTGSSLPRTLTAYYFALFNVIKKYSTSVFCPLVIDSPNQQAQDKQHIEQILSFITENQPEDTQMIIGLEEFYNIDKSNCKIIELTQKEKLLDKNDFESVKVEIAQYLSQLPTLRGRLL